MVSWCQAKHVRLITKCYPPRTANPPKPNSSELSYLTYYTYTTPSKLKKVGRYLEHRVRAGLIKGRTGDVTVTLDICTALIKKCFRDLGLFASNIVAILDAVVKDEELILVEHSVLTLKAFCSHHDGKLLNVSYEYRYAFQSLCKGYASHGVDTDDMRAQYASMDALSALISSEAFHSTMAAGQLMVVVPALVKVLSNSSKSPSELQLKISDDVPSPRERRRSFFTRESVVPQSGTPRSSMQIDYTEEENSVFALKNLKQVCEMNNASLIRIGLDSLIDQLTSLPSSNSTEDYPSWSVELVTLVLSWLPIQHRYLIVSATLEELDGRRNLQDKSISTPKQELILAILEGILTTRESLIGLNVMDVLNSLIEKIAIQLAVRPNTTVDVVQKLVNCIIGLAGHVYYTDQIRDMCSAITEWSKPLFVALNPTSGKDSPATEGEEDSLDIKAAAIWSLRVLKGVLAKGGGSVGLEEVWRGTEGALAGQEGEVRMEYVDSLVTHLRSEDTCEEEQDVQSLARFLTMIHVPIFTASKRGNANPSDYWAIWVLLLALLKKFQAKEVIKALPMMWRLLDIAVQQSTRERRACIEGIFLGFLSIISDTFKITSLKTAEIETRKSLDQWPAFIDTSANPITITLHDISSDSLVFPSATETPHPLPPELQRTSLVNSLAFSNAFPETLREHLLVQWSEETSMQERTLPYISQVTIDLSYTPVSESDGHPRRSRRTTPSLQSPSLEENHPNFIHSRKKSLSRQRAPSPATHIDHLRRVLAGGAVTQPPSSRGSDIVPKIEINGEKVVTPAELNSTPDEKEDGGVGGGDVTMILESLNVNSEWKEKGLENLNEKVESAISPPYEM